VIFVFITIHPRRYRFKTDTRSIPPFAIKTQLLFIALIEKLSAWLLLITVCERVTAVPEHRESSELLKIKPPCCTWRLDVHYQVVFNLYQQGIING